MAEAPGVPTFKPLAPGAKCHECPFFQKGSQFCPHDQTNEQNIVGIVQGESPGGKEVQQGKPFAGPSGQLLDNTLREAGIARSQLLGVNTVACRPPKVCTDAMWRKAISCCAPYLNSTLSSSRGLPILALGDWAMWGQTGQSSITKWYGYPLAAKATKYVALSDTKVLASLHPAFVLREPSWLEEFQETVRRFVSLVKGEWRDWEEPAITCKDDSDSETLTALRALRTDCVLSCDTETAGTDAIFDRILCVALSDGQRAVCVDWPPSPACHIEIKARLESNQPKTFHNKQHDTLVLHKAGIQLGGVIHDTLNRHAALYPGLYHSLSVAAVAVEPAPRWKSEFHDEGADHKGADVFTHADPAKRRRYCALDAHFGQRLDRRLSKLLEQDVVSRRVYEELQEQAEIALHMRRVGLCFNQTFAKARIDFFNRRVEKLVRIFREISKSGRIPDFELGESGTTGAVKRILLDILNLTPVEYTDGGQASTGAWSLQMWGIGKGTERIPGGQVKFAKQFCRLLYKFRRVTHAVDMIEGVRASPDGRVHPPWNPWGALTARWSCSKPNLMNLPKRGIYGIRELLKADPGCCFVAADCDKAEIRAVAYDAGDAPLLKAFETGVDVHLQNAVDLYGDKLLSCSKAEQESCRDLAKRLVYGFNYGAKAETVHHALAPAHPNLQLAHLVLLQAKWFQKHPAIKTWQNRMVALARKQQFIRAPIGHRREFFPNGLVDPNKIYNFPAQAMIAEVIRRAQVVLFNAGWDIRINCHDEIVLNVPLERRYEASAALTAAMEAPFEVRGITRNIPVESKWGLTWGELMSPEKFEAKFSQQKAG